MSLPTPYYDHAGITLYHGDCLEVLPKFGDDAAGVVITDPPYNLGKTYGAHDDRMARGDYEDWMVAWLTQARRVSRDGVIFTYSKRYLGGSERLLEAAGLRQVRFLAWTRRDFAGDKWHGGPAECWEPVVWATKAAKPHYNKIHGHLGRDCLSVASVRNEPYRDQHPCPKPRRVAEWLVTNFGLSAVLDPFAGTATFLEAARASQYEAWGIEIEDRYCEIAAKRLGQEVLFPAPVGPA